MTMTLRLDKDAAAALDAAARRTGKPKNRLVNDAIRQALTDEPGGGFNPDCWRIPARARWEETPESQMIQGAFRAEDLTREQRVERWQEWT